MGGRIWAIGVKGLIEWVAVSALRLGQMVLNASNFLRTDIAIMGIVVISVVAYWFDLFMRCVERRLVPWKKRSQWCA